MNVVLRLCGMAVCAAGAVLLFIVLFPLFLVLFFVMLLSGNIATLRRFSPDRFRTAFRARPVPASEDTIDVKATTVDLDEVQK